MELLKKGKSAGLCSMAVLAILFVNLFASCRLEDCTECHWNEGKLSKLKIHLLSDESKSTVSQTQEQDNAINHLDVFIFKNTDASSSDYGKLDAYKRFEGASLSDVELTTTTGSKMICVIANSHQDLYSSVTDVDAFHTLVTDLVNEKLGDFTMYGEATADVGVNTTVSVLLRRFVSKVAVTSVKTAFSGPYADAELTNCKLYLVNAHGDKLVYDGNSTSTPVVLNDGECVEADVNSCIEEGLLMDSIADAIGNIGHSQPHYFYCYSNETEDMSTCTKLVLQADIEGITYYYPVPVNQVGYGYGAANGHYGVKRNTVYSFGITVTRPGSTDPNDPVVSGTVIINSLEVENWNILPEFNKIF